MAVKTPGQLKALLETGDTPNGQVFADLIDSLRHVGAGIPAAEVTGLTAAIQTIVDALTGSTTNLDAVANATSVLLSSSSGNNATILAATSLAAGLLLPAEKAAIANLVTTIDARIEAVGGDSSGGDDGASAYQLWLAAGNTGTLQQFFDAIGGGGSGGSVDNAGFLKTAGDVTTQAMFSGKLPGTIDKSVAGIATITMLAGVKSGVCVAIPSEYIDRAADGTVTVHLQFETAHPLYKSEITLMPPTSHFFSRATESAGGFDVELRGNNPQSRILPYSQTGRVSVQFAGVPSTPFTIRIHA